MLKSTKFQFIFQICFIHTHKIDFERAIAKHIETTDECVVSYLSTSNAKSLESHGSWLPPPRAL